jgi:polygalacturonase
VDNCFVKCYDDCVVIKAMGTTRRDSRDILITNCLIWNIQAYSVQIGPELLANEVCNVLVKNCDFIHPSHTEKNPDDVYYYYCGSIGILNGDSCDVHNIRYEDIRIEDPTAKLISIKIMKTQWNRDKAFGKIHDIYFKNIFVIDGKSAPSEIISNGLDNFYNAPEVKQGQLIENVTFENLNILGKTIMNVQDGGFIVCPSTVNLKFIK